MRNPIGIAIAALSFIALPAFADTFRFQVDEHPSEGDCHQIAADLGARFERLTGIRPDAALCADISRDTFKFEITYTAAERLAAVSTVNDFSAAQEGVYATRDACEAVKAAETEHFQTVTGLEPIVSYCRLYQLGDETTYELRIDGFGTPAVKPFTTDTMIFERPVDGTIGEFERAIGDALIQRGVDVRYSVLRSGGPYAMLEVLYYAEQEFELSSPELASLDTKAQCLEQLGLARAASASRSEAPVALYCGQSMISTYYVIGIYRDLVEPSDQLSAERFTNYAQCKDQREALVAAYNQRMGGRVTGGLCTKDDELVWRVRLLLH